MTTSKLAAALSLGLVLSTALRAEESAPLPTWKELMEQMAPIGDPQADKFAGKDDPQARQDYFRFLHEMLSQAYFALHYQDPRYPDFWPMFNQVYSYGFANPDDSYYQAALEDSGVYRISGVRGTTRIVDFEIGSGLFIPYGEGQLGPTLAHYDLDHDVKLEQDGTFEVILSAERPKEWKGDWWKLDKGATFLWVRQRAYDWKHEVDGRFAIERLDTAATRPRRTAEEHAAALRQLPKWTAAWGEWLSGTMVNKFLREKDLVNKVAPLDLSKHGGIKTQRYVQGIFELEPDEALILETDIPQPCRYWSWHLADLYTDTLDWMNRHSQVNGFTAKLDKDGKFRAVISAKDPGVPNWLDVVDHRSGMIVGRWKECASYPTPTVLKVKVDEVRKHLPPDTPTVTLAQRDAEIRSRRAAAQMRRRW